ncbi:hypothetical protein BEH94_03110 [Candidatus Altiarchaeales archaeon WOR_SM1_SCG]|nr:hypothetical protein BEH94_03110 [Candidatus Altiarchaeales archaeon WOR_SM1_SCG]
MNDRLWAMYLIGRRDFAETIRSIGIYLIIALSLAISLIILYIFGNAVDDPSVDRSQIINFIFMFVVVGISILYLAVNSVTSIAKEKSDKTIEVLFYGPVDEISFIAGKYLSRICLYLFILFITNLVILPAGLLMGIEIPGDFIKITILSVFLISCIISIGIFLSTLTSSVSGSIVLLIGFFIILFVIQLLAGILGLIPIGMDSTLDILRDIVVGLLNATKYISPLEYFGIGGEAIGSGDTGKYFLSILYSTVYSLVFVLLSTGILMRRGIKQ